ncbi:DUF1992 domain-containing protein [Lentibacillus sp. L22]|uniref:DnaJ family domain-containing protein n=1 Tax=Lentibacillus TaxID=175304 RepID=UPI0022B0B91A|nr:DUF1992 domain-containing protein [Lentibacillus daqui]
MYMFVEERIKDAIDKGEFDDLPGKGKRLNLREELQGLSPEIRMGYRMLKNAGYLAEETDKKRKDITVDDLVTAATGNKEKANVQSKTKFDAFVNQRQLDKNKKFATYAKQIYQKLFG